MTTPREGEFPEYGGLVRIATAGDFKYKFYRIKMRKDSTEICREGTTPQRSRLQSKWIFGNLGRIGYIMLHCENPPETLQLIPSFEDFTEWQTARLKYNVPTGLFHKIFKNLQYAPIINQMERAIRYGHGAATSILTGLADGTIRPSSSYSTKQRPLTELASEGASLVRLASIANVLPTVVSSGRDANQHPIIIVRYDPNPRGQFKIHATQDS